MFMVRWVKSFREADFFLPCFCYLSFQFVEKAGIIIRNLMRSLRLLNTRVSEIDFERKMM